MTMPVSRCAQTLWRSRSHVVFSMLLVLLQFGTRSATAEEVITKTQGSVADDTAEHRSETRLKDLEQVVVTAQKREERLQDVPDPVSVVSADYLVENNKLRLLDYFDEVPGLTVTSIATSGPPGQLVTIRGLSDFGGAATTSIMVDDLNVVSEAAVDGTIQPNIDPSSLSRVEVLRGPQGTLYGANSIGGLVKYVTLDPSTSGVSGQVTAGTETIDHGTGWGYNFRGAVNLPLGGDWAMRMSGFTTKQAGYIDNPAIGINGINEFHSEGGHLAVLWRPTDTLSLRLTAIIQRDYGGVPSFSMLQSNDPSLGFPAPVGNFQQLSIKQIPYETKQQIYGAVLKDKIGKLDLTVVSGYVVKSLQTSTDISFLNFFTQPTFGVAGLPGLSFGRTGMLSQEVRISGPITPHFDFIVGGYYNYQNSPFRIELPATDPITGTVAGVWGYEREPATYSEFAGFSDLTFHATQKLDVQVGLRDSQIRQTNDVTGYNGTPRTPTPGEFTFNEIFNGSSDAIYTAPTQHSYNNAVTYLVTPSYKLSRDVMAYIRVASGYRPGGANTTFPGVPASFGPDKTTDYDLGLKADLMDRRLTLDASAYYIDWKDIQIGVVNQQSIGYTANAGGAKSQGVELSVEARPLRNLKLAAWVAWSEAVLTKSFPASSGIPSSPGDRLPYAPRFSAHFSADEQFMLPGEVTGFIGGQIAYVGDRSDGFQSAGPTGPVPPIDLPPYAKADVHGGARYGAWNVNLYANNVTNRLGVSHGGIQELQGKTVFIQPRTVGVNLTRSF